MPANNSQSPDARSEKAEPGVELVDRTSVRYLHPQMCRIHLGTHGALHVTVLNERIYGGTYAAHSFPVAYPKNYISLLHSPGEHLPHEIGIIRNLDEFPKDQADLVRQALKRRCFVHNISRIFGVGWKQGFVEMDVDTDKGRLQFLMRWQQDRAIEYGGRGKVLIDVNENRYLIPDIGQLSEAERDSFSRFIYW